MNKDLSSAIEMVFSEGVDISDAAARVSRDTKGESLPEDRDDLNNLLYARESTITRALTAICRICTEATHAIKRFDSQISDIGYKVAEAEKEKQDVVDQFRTKLPVIAAPIVHKVRFRTKASYDNMHVLTNLDAIQAELSGVYVIFDDKEIYYVGQSKDIRVRMCHHCRRSDLPDLFGIIIVVTDDRSTAESKLISALKPTTNLRIPTFDTSWKE